jgi:hypothetical protein
MREKLQQLVRESEEEKIAIEETELQDYINRIPQILEEWAKYGKSSYTIYEYSPKGIYINIEKAKLFNRPYKINISALQKILINKYPDLSIIKYRFGCVEDALTISWE